jgi:hypothetical protein
LKGRARRAGGAAMRLRDQRRDDLAPERTHEAFGPASRCYQTILTPDGADVKSLIVSEMTRFFGRELDVSGPKGEAPAAEGKGGAERERCEDREAHSIRRCITRIVHPGPGHGRSQGVVLLQCLAPVRIWLRQ